jgi:hypothetical protein
MFGFIQGGDQLDHINKRGHLLSWRPEVDSLQPGLAAWLREMREPTMTASL